MSFLNSPFKKKTTTKRMAEKVWVLFVLLCVPGFFFNFQPSEPYLTVYLEDEKNISSAVLDTQVWPADVYASLAFVPFVGVMAELVGYLPVILVGIFFREATRTLLIFGSGVTQMVIMQVTYAAGHATNTVLFALPYLVLKKHHFGLVTALQHFFYHLGNVCGSGLAQGLVGAKVVTDLKVLFFLSWASCTVGLVFIIVLWVFLAKTQSKTSDDHTNTSDSAHQTLWSLIRRKGFFFFVRHTLVSDVSVVVAMYGIVMMSGTWSIVGNYFQDNLKSAKMPTKWMGMLELAVEAVFVITTLPAALVRLRNTPPPPQNADSDSFFLENERRTHFFRSFSKKPLFFSGLLSGVMGATLMIISFTRDSQVAAAWGWPFFFLLNLICLGCYQAGVMLLTSWLSMALPSMWAVLLSVCFFLGLVVATVVQQVGVDVGYETSWQFYFLCSFLGLLAAPVLLIASVCGGGGKKKKKEEGEEEEKEVSITNHNSHDEDDETQPLVSVNQ